MPSVLSYSEELGMALRHRQVSGIPLTKVQAIVGTFIGAVIVYMMGIKIWFPLLHTLIGFPEELWIYVATFSQLLYISSCAGVVERNKEGAQFFMGSYTGISFPAGIYLVPKLPFPIITFVARIFLSEEVYKYLGWVIGDEVSVESITVSVDAQGMTSDNIRVRVTTSLVFEVENAATFLSQTKGDTDRSGVITALSGLASARIKERVLAPHAVKELMKAQYKEGYIGISQWITEACNFVQEFGVSLASHSPVNVEILSERVQRAVDMEGAAPIFRKVTNEAALAFAEMVASLPRGTSEEVAYMMFAAERNDQGLEVPPLNMLKIK